MRSNSFQEKKEILLFIDTHVFLEGDPSQIAYYSQFLERKTDVSKNQSKIALRLRCVRFVMKRSDVCFFRGFQSVDKIQSTRILAFFLYIYAYLYMLKLKMFENKIMYLSECRQFIYDDTRSWTSSTDRKKPYRMIKLSQKGKKKKKKKLIKFS